MAGFKKAKKENIWAKILLISPSGGGKSFSALRVAQGMCDEIKRDTGEDVTIAYIGTERSRDLYYANEFNYDIIQLNAPYTPESYIDAIDEAIKDGRKVLVIDSLTHEWSGKGGCLEIHSKIPGNSYTAWDKVTPRHEAFFDKIIDSSIHVVATVRGDDKYVLEEVNGKQVPRKVALGYDQRKNIEYLFTASFNIEQDTHIATAVKDNTHIFEDSSFILAEKHGAEVYKWANDSDEESIKRKQKEVKDSIETGKLLMEKEKEEEVKSISNPKSTDKPAKSKTVEPKEKPIDKETVVEEVSAKDLVNEIGKLFKDKMAQGVDKKSIMNAMADAGTDKPSETTPIVTLQAVIKALNEL